MTDQDDVETFRQQLDETERLATLALEAEAYITLTLTAKPPGGDEFARALVELYRRHGNPSAALRWVAAAREILRQYAEHDHRSIHQAAADRYLRGEMDGQVEGLEIAVRALMSVYVPDEETPGG